MSHADIQEAILDNGCPRCRAVPGERCRTRTGRRATWAHAARSRPIYTAYSLGYEDGCRDGVENPEWAARFVGRMGASL